MSTALGDIIAERELELRAPEESAHEAAVVWVRIGKPRLDPRPGGDWCCPYQIEGLGPGNVSEAYGADAVQALLLTLTKIGIELQFLARTQGVSLSWLEQDDLGFPTPEPETTG